MKENPPRMNTHVERKHESNRQSLRQDAKKQRNAPPFPRFVDNRPSTIVQRSLQDLATDSASVKRFKALQGMANASSSLQHTIQRMGIGAVNYTELHRLLWEDSEGMESLRILDRVNLSYCTAMSYTDPTTGTVTPEPNTLGITFPHESPPKIVINLTANQDNEQLAHTIFHECRHAFDATPPIHDNSIAAKNIDVENEIRTWIREMNFSIRVGGSELAKNIANGDVIPDGHGGHQVDPNLRNRVIAQYRAGYHGVNRNERFDVNNYTFTGETPFVIPRQGFGSKVAGMLGAAYDNPGTTAIGLGLVGAAAYWGWNALSREK